MGIAGLKAPTIATACISGPTSRTTRSNPVRFALLKRITDEVSSRVVSLDALLLPGGFFRLSRPLGHLSFDKRVKELGNAGLVEPLRSLARKLDGPGRALIVFGVDGSDTGNGAGGDQFCIAVSRDGVEGIGRKVFPTTIEAHNLLCFDTDYRTTQRIVGLQSGHRAMLCACYDVFGVAETVARQGKQARNVQWIGTLNNQIGRGSRQFRERLQENLNY